MSHRTSLQRLDNRWHSTPEWYTPGWLLERIALAGLGTAELWTQEGVARLAEQAESTP